MGLPDPDRSRAVLIGVSDYDAPDLSDLLPVERNLTELAALLRNREVWGLSEENSPALLNPRSPLDVLDAVHKAAAEADEACVVYFAGHGLSPEDELYLALPGSHKRRLHYAVKYDDLRKALSTCRARSKVVLLDCCFSGRALKWDMGAPAEFADQTGVEGAYVMTACGETKLAVAPPGETYTAFTGELITTVRTGISGKPDPLDMEAIFSRVRSELIAKGRPVPQQRARNDGARITLVRNLWTEQRSPEAVAYAAALREMFGCAEERAEVQGIARRRFAEATGVPTATLDQYFTGSVTAAADFVDELAGFLAGQGLPVPQPDLDRLHELRRRAQAVDPDPAVQLLHWKEEVQRLKADLTEVTHDRTVQWRQTSLRLAEFDQRLTDLGQRLADVSRHAESVERERDALRTTVDRQQSQLEHARDYVKQAEADLAAREEETRRLRSEVATLREQVRRLREEPPAPDSERATGEAAQITAAASAAPGMARTQSADGTTPEAAPRTPSGTSGTSGMSTTPAGEARPARRIGPVRHLSGQLIAAIGPLAATTAVAGFSGGLQATPGPAVWKLVVYAVVALAGVTVVGVLALGAGLTVLERRDGTRDLSPAQDMAGVTSFLGVLLGLILGFIAAQQGWAGLDHYGAWFADLAGLV